MPLRRIGNRRDRSARLAQLKAETARGETRLIADAAIQVIEDCALGVDIGSPEYRKIAHGLERAELEGLTRAIERDAGRFGGTPTDPIMQPPTVFDRTKGKQILELFDRYAREPAGRTTKDRWDHPSIQN